ncbi:MAG: WbqC family protein [Gemmatimonadota bacterium]
MIAAIHQPQFMPWLGYFDKMDRADCFILLDTVQYKKNEWQNRNRIKTVQGPQWLTVPVRFRHPAGIREVQVNEADNWRHRHWQSLLTNYARAPYWEAVRPHLTALYERPWERLAELNRATLELLRCRLGIGTPLLWASELEGIGDDPTGRLVDLCRAVGAETYLSGADGASYMQLEQFAAAGIEVVFQAYAHPQYPQRFGDFLSHLSTLDLVLNCGPGSLEILRRGRDTAAGGPSEEHAT